MNASPPGAPALWKRALPWLIAAAILAVLFRQVPLPAIRAAIRHGSYLPLAAYVLFEILIALPADAFATRAALAAAGVRRGFGELALARGASYLLGLLSYLAGQGGVGVYLARSGVRLGKATGAVLFLMITNGIVLVWIAAAGLLLDLPDVGDLGSEARRRALLLLILGAVAGTIAYLALIAARPARLAARPALAPLFEAGLGGHLRATAARLPHMLLLAFLHWGAFRVWGIPVPLVRGVALMPIVLLVAAVPITPSGLGTTQALQVLFFSPWSPEPTADGREAAVLAFSLVHQVFSLIGLAAVGLGCLALLARTRPEPEEAQR